MSRVCVTADDFGLRAENDRVIVDLARARRLDAVAVMVHADAALEHVAALRAHVTTGLHLVLIGERPLRPEPLRALLDRDGRLPAAWPALFAAIVRRPSMLEAIRLEVGAQLDRFASLGLTLGFVNAHQHAHLFPAVWPLVRAELAARSLAPAVRVAAGMRPKELALVAAQRVAFATSGPPEGSTLVAHGLA
ncbi:MAG: ChbG/HpnK family deacetylase, partial [Myxococcota bacterium]|nr:ChbG/HpnK family deacetylase [Myxococcota bacterium]